MKKTVDVIKLKMVRESEVEYESVSDSGDANRIFRSLGLADAAEEEFWMLAMDAKGNVIGAHMVSRGSIQSTEAHPREIYKRALLNNACAIIVAHCHPSGDCTPSSEDIATTKRLAEAGEILGIRLMDHLILTTFTHLSFHDESLL